MLQETLYAFFSYCAIFKPLSEVFFISGRYTSKIRQNYSLETGLAFCQSSGVYLTYDLYEDGNFSTYYTYQSECPNLVVIQNGIWYYEKGFLNLQFKTIRVETALPQVPPICKRYEGMVFNPRILDQKMIITIFSVPYILSN